MKINQIKNYKINPTITNYIKNRDRKIVYTFEQQDHQGACNEEIHTEQ